MTIAKLSLHSPFSNSRMGTADPTWRICSTMVCLWRVVRNGCSSAASKANPAFRSKNSFVTECMWALYFIGHRPGLFVYDFVKGAFWKEETHSSYTDNVKPPISTSERHYLVWLSFHRSILPYFSSCVYVCLYVYQFACSFIYEIVSHFLRVTDWLPLNMHICIFLLQFSS